MAAKFVPVLQASTSEAMESEGHPRSESYWGHVNPIGPRACYERENEWLKHCALPTRNIVA